jgi:hypothetical protein
MVVCFAIVASLRVALHLTGQGSGRRPSPAPLARGHDLRQPLLAIP